MPEENVILVSAETAGKLFGLSPWTIRRMAYAGEIQPHRKGKAIRFDPQEIKQFMLEQGQRQPVIPRPRKKDHGK